MRMMSATGCTKIFPSPICPVCAAVATMRTTVSTWPLQCVDGGGARVRVCTCVHVCVCAWVCMGACV